MLYCSERIGEHGKRISDRLLLHHALISVSNQFHKKYLVTCVSLCSLLAVSQINGSFCFYEPLISVKLA